MCILRLYAKQILLCPESGIFMPSDLNDPVISCACKLEKFLCALVRELLCLESGNIELRYSNMHEETRTTVSHKNNRAPAGVWFDKPIAYHSDNNLYTLVTTPSIFWNAR